MQVIGITTSRHEAKQTGIYGVYF